jgi:hypothetical protein
MRVGRRRRDGQAAKICECSLAPSRAAIRGSGRTAAEFEAVQREQFFADPDSVTADLYPRGTIEGANDGD